MKRLTFLVLAGITAFDLHAAVLQGWVFRDVNANGQRDATLTDATQVCSERVLSIDVPNGRAFPILKLNGGRDHGNTEVDNIPVAPHLCAAGFSWPNGNLDSELEAVAFTAVAFTAGAFTIRSNKYQGVLS